MSMLVTLLKTALLELQELRHIEHPKRPEADSLLHAAADCAEELARLGAREELEQRAALLERLTSPGSEFDRARKGICDLFAASANVGSSTESAGLALGHRQSRRDPDGLHPSEDVEERANHLTVA
jgi:hypothetical protein